MRNLTLPDEEVKTTTPKRLVYGATAFIAISAAVAFVVAINTSLRDASPTASSTACSKESDCGTNGVYTAPIATPPPTATQRLDLSSSLGFSATFRVNEGQSVGSATNYQSILLNGQPVPGRATFFEAEAYVGAQLQSVIESVTTFQLNAPAPTATPASATKTQLPALPAPQTYYPPNPGIAQATQSPSTPVPSTVSAVSPSEVPGPGVITALPTKGSAATHTQPPPFQNSRSVSAVTCSDTDVAVGAVMAKYCSLTNGPDDGTGSQQLVVLYKGTIYIVQAHDEAYGRSIVTDAFLASFALV